MKKNRFLKSLTAAALLGFHLSTPAEDIDLFANASSASADEVPNVLLIVDNTANWNTAFTSEMAALSSVFSGLPANKFRVGVMLNTETGGANSGEDGGYVRAAIRLMDSTHKTKYQALINSLNKNNDKGNGGKSSLVMSEAYRYFSAGAPYSGNNKVKTDYTGNTSGTTQDKAIYALTGNALTSKAGTAYANPVTAGCQQNYIIYISNGPSQDSNSVIAQATSMLSAAGGNTTQLSLSPNGSQDNVSDEWARYMKQSSLGVVTYTIDVNPDTSGQGPGWTALLKSMASVSSGKYYSVSTTSGSSEIVDALNKTFSEIQAVNSVFAAVSLPVSVNTQGSYLNQVYVGMFRPDPDSAPRWAGNLKQYKMGFINDELKLQDADDASAINNQTGFITECARSYWTPSTTDTYWQFKPQGACIPAGPDSNLYMNSNYPDGNIVEKGAQGYKLRSTTARTLKTCSTTFASCTSLTNFDTSNGAITAAALGTTDEQREALINWVRGQDVDDEHTTDGVTPTPSTAPTTSTVMRPSVHSDIVHSRPVALNLGTDESPQVVVFYGGNDGILRAINGNRTSSIGSVAAGSELWAFVAPEFYSSFTRIRDNTPDITTPAVAGSADTKPYGIDGPVSAYKSGSDAWVYATMRRGGRVLYAFNVNVNDLTDITLKWKKGCPNRSNDTDCSTGFDGIGQTWSAPKTLKSSGYGGGSSPMLIMGGGYDTCEDVDSASAECTTTKGNKIYVLDADTGALLKALDTERAVVGDVVVVSESGLAKYAYATDLGGNIYRVNIDGDPASWTLTKVASLGCPTTASCAPNAKFMFGVDVVKEEDGVYVLLVGSGDREKPLKSYTNAYNLQNYFFMVQDKPSDSSWLSGESATCGASVICRNSLYGPIAYDADDPEESDVATKKGWYLSMRAHEQVVTSAITLFGVVTFSTHQPAEDTVGSCGSNLGTARVYNIRYTNAGATGTSRAEQVSGGGLPPSPVAGYMVDSNGMKIPFCIGCSADSPLEAKKGDPATTSTVVQPVNRVYWYIQQ